jgi:Transposase DDE domain group 1
MANPAGESDGGVLRVDFDRRLMLQFRGSVVTSDAGLLAYRELDDALGLTTVAGEMLADARTGSNGRHALVGLFRQSVFGRLAGYEDVNDAERLRHDPAMRWIVGGKAAQMPLRRPKAAKNRPLGHPGICRNYLYFHCAAEDQAIPRGLRDNRKGRRRWRFDMGKISRSAKRIEDRHPWVSRRADAAVAADPGRDQRVHRLACIP